MVKTLRAFFLSFTIAALLLFSVIGTTTVYADDGTGTDTTTETETPVPTEEGQATEVVTEVTPVPTEEGQATEVVTEVTPVPTEEGQATEVATEVTPIPTEEGQATEVVTEEAGTTEQDLGQIMEQVPDNTTVTVLNAEGEALPLASQESADAIVENDPIWCPATQTTPTPGLNGCTGSFTNFTDLLAELQKLQADNITPIYQGAGTIFVEQGNYAGSETAIVLDSNDLSNISNSDLTVQGGWNTSTGTTTDTTQFNIPISIGSSSNPWGGSLTINNIGISGVDDQAGLTLYSQNDITLDNVEVTNSQSGAELNAGANVNVKNSKFNNNGSGNIEDPVGKGVDIVSGGSVSLASIEANNNQLFGANVQAVGDVTVSNGFFSSNQGIAYVGGWVYDGYGIQVITTGDIGFDNVTANDNYVFGAHLEGGKVTVTNSSFNETSSDWEEDPIGYGLEVISTDNVNLSNVSANDNQLFGANIQTAGAVTVTDSFFSGNTSYYWWGDKTYYGYGLQIVTNQEVSLVNVTAEENFLFGTHIEASDVAIDTGFFNNNGSGSGLDLTGRGLEIISQYEVALANVNANNNQLFGADIQAGDLVAITQSNFNGHITYVYDYFSHEIASRDGGYGLKVVTGGNIALDNVNANENYLYGTYLEGDDTAIEDSSFTANGSGLITEPTGYGLQVVSTGSVSLYNINSADSVANQLFGADITAVQDVTIVNSFFSGHQTVTFDPCDGLTFYGYGLNVVTAGDIDLNYVAANYNNLWGASLTGNNVIIANSQFNNNVSDSNIFIDDTGLIVNASGYVDIYKSEAKENRLIGATITAGGDVYIELSDFNDNRGFTCSLTGARKEASLTTVMVCRLLRLVLFS